MSETQPQEIKKTRVAINGFGRIGRAFFKLAFERPELEIVAINDLSDAHNLGYLLQYDSAQGYTDYHIDYAEDGSSLTIDEQKVMFLQQRDPAQLPWKDMNIDIVVESTGFFTDYNDAKMHLDAGAKHVVISAPAKGEAVDGVSATVLMGVNDDQLATCSITSNASCTTNSGSPVMTILSESIGIEKAMLNTIHGYTATQSLVDGPDKKDYRRGRAAAQNIIPTTTGAAKATALALPQLKDKFDGIAMRVPVVAGSIADITFIASRDTSVEEINNILKKAAEDERWHNIFTVNEDPIVSSDIIGSTYASIVDLSFTKVVDGNLVKVLAWYDNEMGYTNSLVEHVVKAGKKFNS
ncbi:type I glyceraldehyde-3-phosphate dehydrogenase [Candidatus Nomurabacteria bacterium]|nr:type I glyceraldehyde-3-phosphate dehydrogenase [Candidatus Nomurabacteria bacterium]